MFVRQRRRHPALGRAASDARALTEPDARRKGPCSQTTTRGSSSVAALRHGGRSDAGATASRPGYSRWLSDGLEVAPGNLSILVTLPTTPASLCTMPRCFGEPAAGRRQLERRALELEGTLRRLEQAGRRQLISEERNRIARELHDSVAQHLLTIGMDLEWCRRHRSIAAGAARAGAGRPGARSLGGGRDPRGDLRAGPTTADRAASGVREAIQASRPAPGLRSVARLRADPAGARRTQHALVQIAREALPRWSVHRRGAPRVGRAPLADASGVTIRVRRRWFG